MAAVKVFIFLQDIDLGGALRQASLLSDGLMRKGHEVAVAGWASRNEGWRFVWNAPVEPKVLFTTSADGVLDRMARVVRTSAALRRRLEKDKFDVLYVMQGDVARLIAWLATRHIHTRLVWGLRGSPTGIRMPRGWRNAALLRLSTWASQTAPLIIANSAAGYAGRRPRDSRGLVIHNGFDTERFKPDLDARRRVRSEWGVAEEKLIGVGARLSDSKGHAVFIKAAVLLAGRRADARFVIAGEGPERDRLRRLAREAGLAEKVIWAGARADMPAVYNAFDVVCSPSLRGEGCPNVIGEAMASGVPCVVTDVGASATLAGGLCAVVPPGDATALADALGATLDRLEQIDRLQLRERIVTEFSAAAMVERTERALAEIAALR
jgi:glycosyltransferase involved in cell wall biosynthesis